MQWFSESRLIDLLIDIRDETKIPKHLTGAELLTGLIDSNLIRPLPANDFSENEKPYKEKNKAKKLFLYPSTIWQVISKNNIGNIKSHQLSDFCQFLPI